MPELSILIPCLNEADSLPLLIERLEKLSISTDLDVETIVLDDASTDDTIEVARALQATRAALNIRIIHRFEPRIGHELDLKLAPRDPRVHVAMARVRLENAMDFEAAESEVRAR